MPEPSVPATIGTPALCIAPSSCTIFAQLAR